MTARAWRAIRAFAGLEEVGQPYEVRLVSFAATKEPAHLRLHPFGLIPTYEEGDLVLFETGAIVLHIAERLTGHWQRGTEPGQFRTRDHPVRTIPAPCLRAFGHKLDPTGI